MTASVIGHGIGRLVIGLLATWLGCASAMAQPAAAPEPILRVTLEPSRVVVGQAVTLRIELLAPNYLTAPPIFTDVQIRNAVTRPLGNINLSEQHQGMTYAGVRHELAIHPQAVGAYAITNQKVSLTYAAEPPATREVTLDMPPLTFDAEIPDAARTLDPFIAASALALRQTIEPSSDDPKVGDSVTRTVTIEAQGLPAMILPPPVFAASDGLAVYPDQPSLQDRADRRTDVLTGTRVDRVHYILQKQGAYVLPAIEVTWWNMDAHKIERARVEPVTLHVRANPAVSAAGVGEGETRWRVWGRTLLARWPWLVVVIAIMAGLIRFAPRTIGVAWQWCIQRRIAYRQSEAWSFARLRQAARMGDAKTTYFALEGWLARFEPAAPQHTIGALKAVVRDPVLDRQLADIEERLFGPTAGGAKPRWSPRLLLKRVAAARRHLHRHHRDGGGQSRRVLPTMLNPRAGEVLARAPGRPVAR